MDQFPFPVPFPVWHPVYMVSMFTNLVTIPMAAHLLDPTTIQMALSTVLQPTAKEKDMRVTLEMLRLARMVWQLWISRIPYFPCLETDLSLVAQWLSMPTLTIWAKAGTI